MALARLRSWLYPQDDEFSASVSDPGIRPLANSAPIVNGETVTLVGGASVSAHESVLLANDSDPDGDALSISGYTAPAHGTLTRAADGTLTYTPAAGYVGPDSFGYQVIDAQGAFTNGTVTFEILAAGNQPPVVNNEFATVQGGSSVSAHESILLANDADPEGGALSIQSYTQPANGTLQRAADGTLTYTPRAGFSGTDTFTYTVADSQGATSLGSVTLTVLPGSPLAAPTVAIAEDLNNDGLISRAELQGRVDVRVGLPNGAQAGQTITLTDNAGNVAGKLLGAADIAAGSVLFADAFAAPAEGGTFSVSAQLSDASGAVSPTATDSAVLDTLAPGVPQITLTTDTNNDGRISSAELLAHGGRLDLRIDLPLNAVAGDKLSVTDQAGRLVDVTLTAAHIAARSLTLVGAFPAPADGQTATVSAKLADAAGNASAAGSDSALLRTSAPTPTVTLTDDADNDGVFTRPELGSATRADVRVGLPAGAAAGDVVEVRDNQGNSVVKTLAAADLASGQVLFTDAFPLPAAGGTLSVFAKLTDAAGNVSPEASDSALFNANYAPSAVDDTATLQLGAGLAQATGNVLTNDTDPDGSAAALRVSGVSTSPAVAAGTGVGQVLEGVYGHLSLNPDGSYLYVADKAAGLTAPVQDVFYYLNKDAANANSAVPAKLTVKLDPALANVLSVSSPQVEEGGDLVFTVGTSATAAATTVTLALASGSATVGVDTGSQLQVNLGAGWVNLVGGAVQLAANTSSFQVRLSSVNDGVLELNETVTLRATSANGSSAIGTGTLIDNDLSAQVSGTEDTPLVLTWAQFNLQGLPGAAPKLVIESLPADGKLQFNSAGTWVAVTAGQQIAKADVDAGKLRFLPDPNEAGSNAYNAPGLGNKFNDYAKFSYGGDDGAGNGYSRGTMTIDIAPKVDGGQSVAMVVLESEIGDEPPGIPDEETRAWSRVVFNVSGAPVDTDGSERYRVGLTNMSNNDGIPLKVYTLGAVYIAPDAAGIVWVNPGEQVYITSNDSIFYWGDYALYRQELNAQGGVIEQVASPAQHFSLVSPLTLDLNGDGVQTVNAEAGAYFDLDNDGVATRSGWVTPQDGLLARDLDGNGRIDDGSELFGNATPLADGSPPADGFEALGALDGNHDGVVNAADAGFGDLLVWQDGNGDGISQPGELHSLASLGIVALNLAPSQGPGGQHGNVIGLVSSYVTADGASHELADVWFADTGETSPAEPLAAADVLGGGDAAQELARLLGAPAETAAPLGSLAQLEALSPTAAFGPVMAPETARVDWLSGVQAMA